MVGLWCCLAVNAVTFEDWQSTNKGQGNSESKQTYTLNVAAGDKLSFDWEVSSESGWDILTVKLDDKEILYKSGEASGTYTKDFTSSGTHTLLVMYTKDDETNEGRDCAWISNIKLENPYKGTTGNGLAWSYDKTACKLSITGNGAMDDWTSSTLSTRPWSSYMNSVRYIEIGDGITSIGNYAFYQNTSLLKNIHIASTVTSIGDYSFFNCEVLPLVVIPEGVKKIGAYAFYRIGRLNNKSASVVLPSTLNTIGNYAFYCGDGTEDESYVISVYSFAYYPPTIQNNTFCTMDNEFVSVYCTSTTNYSDWTESTPKQLPSTSGISGSTMYKYESGKLTLYPGDGRVNGRIYALSDDVKAAVQSVHISGHATSIVDFSGYTGLTSITIPSTVKSVGGFSNCHSLGSITIPSSVTDISSFAFQFCKNLKEINLSEGLKRIGFLAFVGCEKLENLHIPASVDSIEYGITSRATSLKSIIVDEDNPKFDSRENCNAIIKTRTNCLLAGCQTSTIPNGVSIIDDDAFTGQTELTEITIPASVTSIGYHAFYDCSSLTSIVCEAMEPPTCESSVFGNVDKSILVYVPSVATYLSAEGWSKFTNIQEIAREVDILDASEAFAQNEDEEYASISYTRNFRNTKWQALYVPFEIPVTEELLADFEVADLNDVRQYDRDDDGVKDSTVIESFKVTRGILEANYPYLIRAKVVGEKTITVTNAILYAAEENSIDCSSIREKFTFTGTYSRLSSEELPQGEGYYALSGGVWKPIAEGTSLGAFRFYLKIDGRNSSNSGQNNVIRMRVIDENGNEDITGIESLTLNPQLSTKIYDLQGRRVEKPSKGMYIVNGKKVVIK